MFDGNIHKSLAGIDPQLAAKKRKKKFTFFVYN